MMITKPGGLGPCPECGKPFSSMRIDEGHGIEARLFFHDAVERVDGKGFYLEGGMCVVPLDPKTPAPKKPKVDDDWDGGQYYDNYIDGRGF
jgi:hypothetical protein